MMPAPVWSFPIDCSCARFKIQIAIRHWIGARLAHVATNTANPNDWNLAAPMHFFRRYRQVNSATSRAGFLNFTAGDFTIDWSTAAASFGNPTVTGTLPTSVEFPGQEFSILPTIKVVGPMSLALNSVAAVGAYVFEHNSDNLSLPYSLLSFEPGPDLTVTLHDRKNIGRPDTYTITQEFTEHLSRAAMAEILQADLDAVTPIDFSLMPRGLPVTGQRHCFGDFFDAQRGGVFEMEEGNAPIEIFSDGQLRNLDEADFVIDDAWRFGKSALENGSFPDSGGEVTRGHAARWLDLLPKSYFKAGVRNISPDAGFLMQCLVYETGNHSVRTATLPAGAPDSCADISVACDGPIYLLEPPHTEATRRVIDFDTPCS